MRRPKIQIKFLVSSDPSPKNGVNRAEKWKYGRFFALHFHFWRMIYQKIPRLFQKLIFYDIDSNSCLRSSRLTNSYGGSFRSSSCSAFKYSSDSLLMLETFCSVMLNMDPTSFPSKRLNEKRPYRRIRTF